jgi:tRNA threonylcarbamoyladenosine biosynthesis protein TsaB
LAINTATKSCSAAVADEEGIKAGFFLESGLTYSQSFLPLTDALLTSAGMDLSDMSAVAVTAGPGSFTGLRIGIATAKAWGQSLDLPLIAVSTLEALYAAVSVKGLVCPVLDARKNEVYCALFEDGKRLWADSAMAPGDLLSSLKALRRKIIFCGDGIIRLRGENAFAGNKYFFAEENVVSAACGAAILGCRAYRAGNFISPYDIMPQYLRLSEAERKRLRSK